MDKQTEMNKMMNQYLEHTYKDKNVLKVQKCRWNKRLQNKDFKGSDLSLMNMLEFMIYQKNIYNNFIKFIMFNNSINMPVKTGKDKGLLTTGEIRKLISAHNKLSKIVVPKGTDRQGLEKLIKSNGYKINHKEQRLDPQPINRPPQKTITMPPKKLTEKQKAKEDMQKASLKIFLDNSAKAKKVSVVKPSQSFNVKNTKVAQVKNKPPPVKKDVYPAYVKTKEDKMRDKLIETLEIVSTRLKETLLKNKNNFGFNSDPVNTNKDFTRLFEKLVTQLHTKDIKKLSPVSMENIKSIVNTINAYPPKDNEGIKSPLIKYPPLVIRTDAKNFKNYINEKSRLSRNKILKERRDALKPKKEVVKKPAKEDKALQKKLDYDQEIEERLKKLNDNLISNKNVLSGFVGNQQGDFMKLFTDIYKMGRGIVPKDFSSKSIEYATNLLNIVYSNPPKDKEGLIMPEQAFKTSPKGDGIFKPWISYLSETSEKQRRQVMKGYDEDKKPADKKPAVDYIEVENPLFILASRDKNSKVNKLIKIKSIKQYANLLIKIKPQVNKINNVKDGSQLLKKDKDIYDEFLILWKKLSSPQTSIKISSFFNEEKPPEVKKPVEDTKQAQEGENRIDIYGTQGDKKRLIVKQDKTFDTIKSLLDKDGYIMTKQQEDLFNGNIVDYVKEQKKPARINIKPAKGKTDMMIISIEGHSFGQGAASIRIKKKEVKKPAVKKEVVKKESVKKVSVKKQPVEEDDESDSDYDEEEEPREITAMNDPLTRDLIRVVQLMRNKIKKEAKEDPSKLTSRIVINKKVRPIREFIRDIQRNNNVEFSKKIIEQYEDDLILNLIDDLMEIGGLKK